MASLKSYGYVLHWGGGVSRKITLCAWREDIRGDGGYQMLRICEKEFLPKFPCGYTRVIGREGDFTYFGGQK